MDRVDGGGDWVEHLGMGQDAFQLRFVVLRHEGHGEGHFDVMFETSRGSKLATWQSGAWPMEDGAAVRALADHRAEYLAYEGEVSGGRGFVRRVASGRHAVREDGEVLVVELEDGRVLRLPRWGEGKAGVIAQAGAHGGKP